MVKFSNVTITSTAQYTFSGIENLWFDRCKINSSANDLVDNCRLWYVTRCAIPQLKQGIRPFSTQNTAPALVRGNDLSGFLNSILVYTAIGNLRMGNYHQNATLFVTQIIGQTAPWVQMPICAFNTIYGFQCTDVNVLAFYSATQPVPKGGAVIQNLFENTVSGPSILAEIAADNTTVSPVDNFLIWHNTFVGQRWNNAYNDTGTNACNRYQWSIKNNLFDDYNVKTDIFTGAGGASGERIGNWPVVYGVGSSGNVFGEIQGIGAPGSFLSEFSGLSSVVNGTIQNTNTFFNYLARKSYDGINVGGGMGDYHLEQPSPAIGLPQDYLLPYDLDGHHRHSGDASGVYTFGVSPSPTIQHSLILPNSHLQFTLVGLADLSYEIQQSTDLVSWETTTNIVLPPDLNPASIQIEIESPISNPTFFRAVLK